MRTLLTGAMCALALAASMAATAQAQHDTQLISRDVLFGNPDRASVQISPDGSKLSFLAPVDGVLNVWVGPVDNPDAAEPVTNDTGRGVRTYFWSFTNQHIVYVQDQGGDENWRVYATDIATGDTNDLTPFEGVQAQINRTSRKHPEEILIGLRLFNPIRRCRCHGQGRAGGLPAQPNLGEDDRGRGFCGGSRKHPCVCPARRRGQRGNRHGL